jgi:thymidylate synthase
VSNIYARNVSEALYLGLMHLRTNGLWQETRTGKVLEAPNPVMTIYKRPEERVLFYPQRDANPFFHLFESFWMLYGRKDLAYIQKYNKRMEEFSDDGKTLRGSYGYRWHTYFGFNQLEKIIEHLEKEPNSRRAVLQMWHPNDLHLATKNSEIKDVPCNTQIYFKIKNDRLNMTVSCRSNDIIWGAYGANAVHFSVLQEYIASSLGLSMGTYYHFSDSFHAYEDTYNKCLPILEQKGKNEVLWYDSYLGWNKGMHYTPEHMFEEPDYILEDLDTWFKEDFYNPDVYYYNPFFKYTAIPMAFAWNFHKRQNYKEAIIEANKIISLDWKKASIEWLERRANNAK